MGISPSTRTKRSKNSSPVERLLSGRHNLRAVGIQTNTDQVKGYTTYTEEEEAGVLGDEQET